MSEVISEDEIREYELIYILQPNVDDAGITAVSERISQLVSDQGGQILESELWGRRQLAYPINNHFEGIYRIERLELEPAKTKELERVLRFTDNIIRYMVIRTDDE